MPSSPRAELIAIQKKLWRSNRDIIEHSILIRESGFDSYERNYIRAVKDYETTAHQEEMMEAVFASDIIFVGDYHTCKQSQRSFLRILKAVIKDDDHFIVGLELLHKRYQDILDLFMSDKLKEESFLKKIKLQEHWIFDLWENFEPIFDFCKFHKIPVFAIDSAPEDSNVRQRDAATAKLIGKIIAQNPGRRLFVFIGDLHIAPDNLPKNVTGVLEKLGISKKMLTLYEVSESIYWKLAEKGIEDHAEIVRLADGSFCRMHTPPVVCQRSYLNWLEHEEGEIDYADAKVSFLELVDRILEFLGLTLGKKRDEVEVFTSGDLSFLKKIEERGDFSKHEIKIIKRQILASESYYIAKARIVYLANLSVNHAAEEAAHFIKNVLAGPENPRPIVDAFYANVLHEALGFFGSKLINHKRKCWHEKDFKNLTVYFQTVKVPPERRLEYETARLVLEYKELERKGSHLTRTEIFRSRMDIFLALTHALGYMLGDRLYYGLINRAVPKTHVRKLFTDPWENEGDPLKVYTEISGKIRGVKIPKRM